MSCQRVEIPAVGECYLADKATVAVLMRSDDAPPDVESVVALATEGPDLALPMALVYDEPADLDQLIARLIGAREAVWGVKTPCQCPKCRARRAAGEAG